MSTEGNSADGGSDDVRQQITHRPAEHRFVLTDEGVDLTHVEYVDHEGVWFITHTFTEPAARGRGLAAVIVKASLDAARERGVRVRPVCPFVVDYIDAHPEYRDLLVSTRSQ